MVSAEEQLKAEEEQLLNENPDEAATAETTPAAGKLKFDRLCIIAFLEKPAENGSAAKTGPPVEETHITEFDLDKHATTFHEQIVHLRDEKLMNDGNLVFVCGGTVR